MNTQELGRRVKMRRQQLGMTGHQVADELGRLGVKQNQSSLSRLENGKAGDDMSHSLVRGLARVLNTSIDWLVEGDSPEYRVALEQLGASVTLQVALVRIGTWYSVASEPDRFVFEQMMAQIANSLNRPPGRERVGGDTEEVALRPLGEDARAAIEAIAGMHNTFEGRDRQST